MRILHISSEKTWRGGEQQIAYLIDELKSKGVESVVILRKDSAFEKHCIQHSVEYYVSSFRNEFDLATAYQIKKLSQKNIAVVHSHTAKSHGLAVLAATMFGMKSPLVVSKRTDHPIHKNWFSKFKFNTPKVRKILCVSQKIKEIIDRDLLDKTKSIAVYSGIDLTKFKFEKKYFFHELLGLDRNIKIVGNASAISPHKDYFTFVNTAKKVCEKRRDVRFLIIGDGPLENEIRQYVNEQGLSEKVLFTGFLNNLSEILFNLDVFLITSNEEGLGTTILDAHACRVPVVATRAGGIPEIVINGVSGTLCEIGDSAALAAGVLARLEDHNLFDAAKLVEKFSKRHTAEKTLEIYREVLLS